MQYSLQKYILKVGQRSVVIKELILPFTFYIDDSEKCIAINLNTSAILLYCQALITLYTENPSFCITLLRALFRTMVIT